ncbi:MAG: EAL domain-containing protein [Spirochaetales bacterium]|nr:EAL domain-containing protein [Spirochaetales bacterium]
MENVNLNSLESIEFSLTSLFASWPEGMVLLDDHFRILSSNAVARSLGLRENSKFFEEIHLSRGNREDFQKRFCAPECQAGLCSDWEDMSLGGNFLRGFFLKVNQDRTLVLLRDTTAETYYRVLMDQAPDAILIFDHQGTIIKINQMGIDLLGFQAPQVEGRFLSDFVAESERRLLPLRLARLLKGQLLTVEINLITASGHLVPFEVRAREIGQNRIQAILHDLTRRKLHEMEMEFYGETMELFEEVALELDAEMRITRHTRRWDRIFQRPARDIGHFLTHVREDYQDLVRHHLQQILSGNRDRAIIQFKTEGAKNALWVEGKFRPLIRDGKICGVRSVLRDASIDHITEKQINFYTNHDTLTGLPNRTRLEEKLRLGLRRSETQGTRLILGFIDLDFFNQINNFYGHRAGDYVLQQAAERIVGVVGVERLFRWSGDRFALLIPEAGEKEQADQVASLIFEAMRRPFDIDEQQHRLTSTLGIAIYPDDGLTADHLIRMAEQALLYAKASQRNHVQLASRLPMRTQQRDQLILKNRLLSAVENEELQAFFQPKIDARSGKVVGMEALARWLNPDGNPVAGPGTFIPIAENAGIIGEVSRIVNRRAFRFLADLHSDLNLSINVSRHQLFQPDFLQNLRHELTFFALQPEQITLEITESLAMRDPQRAEQVLSDLKRDGFNLSIDDFGTGYSGLSQLHLMPVHELKLDITFVHRIHTLDGFNILKAITAMAQALQLGVVAEGVEDFQALQSLIAMGVETIQGNYFSPPVNEALFQSLLTDPALAQKLSADPAAP